MFANGSARTTERISPSESPRLRNGEWDVEAAAVRAKQSPLTTEWWDAIQHQSRGARVWRVFAVVALAITGPLFVLYWLAAYGNIAFEHLPPSNFHHVLVNVAFNIACMAVAYNVRGDVNQRLRSSLIAVFLMHGALVVFIIVTRSYYSRTIVPLAFVSSVSLVTVISLASYKLFPMRLGIIPGEMQKEVWQWLPAGATLIAPDERDLSKYDLVLVDWNAINATGVNDLISRAILSGCPVQHVARYTEERSGRVSLDHFAPEHALRTLNGFYVKYVKQPVDILLVVILLPVAVPLLLCGMLCILIFMGRPVFFIQERVGWGGMTFRMFKLRTMTVASTSASVATSIGDQRVTPLGRILRRYRIDELPQLFNVLIGNMSLIGPRPEQPKLVEQYVASVPTFAYRHFLLPGITGWAQIRSRYAANEQETREKLTYDLFYLKNASLLLDLQIVFETTRAILVGNSVR